MLKKLLQWGRKIDFLIMGTESSLVFVHPLHHCETDLAFLGALEVLRSNLSFALIFVIQQS